MIATTALGAVGGTVNLLGQILPPLGDAWSQLTYNISPVKIPDVGTLIHLRMRGILTEGQYEGYMRWSGVKEKISRQLVQGAQQLISAQDAIFAKRRGIISEERMLSELEKQGITGDLVSIFEKVSQFYPGPADLIRFAVREVYSPAIVDKFGMMEGLPSQFISEARKVGVSEEQAKNFWAAHWELPSPNQGFEMLHRGIIQIDELKLLLQTLDVMPFWRDKLIQLSYNPLTRVDVRRMYRLGVMSEADLLRAYMNLGYSPEDAQRMVEFTKKFESGEDKGITRSAVQSAYKKGIITPEEFREYLLGLDYPSSVVDFWVEVTEYEMVEKEVDEAIDDVVSRYKIGELTLEGVKLELDKLGLPADFATKVVRDLQGKVSTKLKLPSNSDLTQWLKLGIIDFLEYGQRMTQLGYKEDDIVLFITEAQAQGDVTKRSYLGKTHYQKLLKAQIISMEYFRQTMQVMGVTTDDIEAMMYEVIGGEKGADK